MESKINFLNNNIFLRVKIKEMSIQSFCLNLILNDKKTIIGINDPIINIINKYM